MDSTVVKVKLCGNCNPRYNVISLLNRVALLGGIRFKYVMDETESDVIVNSCEIGCIKNVNDSKKKVLVSGYSVNKKTVDKEHLAEEISKEIRRLFKG